MVEGLILTKLLFWVGLVHVLDALLLVFLVLLHSGKGGGLSDMFGGSIGQTAAGSTVAEPTPHRLPGVCALVFGSPPVPYALLLNRPARGSGGRGARRYTRPLQH